MFTSSLRNSQQPWEAALSGLCVLPVRVGSAPIPAQAAGGDFSAAPAGDGDGGAAAPESAGLPVEVSAGRSFLVCRWLLTFQPDRWLLSCTLQQQIKWGGGEIDTLIFAEYFLHVFTWSFPNEGWQLRAFAWHHCAEDLHHGETSGLCCGWSNFSVDTHLSAWTLLISVHRFVEMLLNIFWQSLLRQKSYFNMKHCF